MKTVKLNENFGVGIAATHIWGTLFDLVVLNISWGYSVHYSQTSLQLGNGLSYDETEQSSGLADTRFRGYLSRCSVHCRVG